MTFIAKNPLTIPEVEEPASVPKSGTRGLFAGKDGWYEIDSAGKTKKISPGSGLKTIAGMKGYYYCAINFGNPCTITLTTTQIGRAHV